MQAQKPLNSEKKVETGQTTEKKQTQEQGELWGKKVYLVFQCVHLEDSYNPQFQFKRAFWKQAEAKAYKQTLVGLFRKFHEVVALVVEKAVDDPNRYLNWIQRYEQWGACECRMMVSYKQIQKSIKSAKK